MGATVESDTVETATERKVIQFSADEDLLRYVATTFLFVYFPRDESALWLEGRRLHPSTSQAPMKPPITKLSEIRERLNYTRVLNGSLQRQFMLKEKDFFYASNEEIGNAIEQSLKFEDLEEAWIISQKKKSFNNNSLEKIKLIFEPPSNNVSLNEEVLKDKAKDCYENDKEG
ncbi:hypothetical protein RhiirA4_471667 [Rhizophagus irregularis]|uniref:Uncharacterized protein n=1 Tax=Rhizophagus irregularis TaxID=588596 RepID=A0A2I1H3L0_9GLOM|nr:hypothetical protein RhiirA4_471667 [Rhizophagus irregularis]